MSGRKHEPYELGRQTYHQGRCLAFQSIAWQDDRGRERTWETVDRVGGRAAVMTIPWLVPSRRLVLIRQYRPPARSSVLEFPAGLVDEGESPEQAGLRELAEEAGYRGRAVRTLPAAYNTPGLSGETVHPVFVEIDESDPANVCPAPEPEDGESIEVVLVAHTDLADFLQRECEAGTRFDSKVMTYLLGLTQVNAEG